jgi:hypothetical protein
MTRPGDKPPDDHADERRRQFEESRGLRGRPELPLEEEEEEDEGSSDDDEPEEEKDET